MRNRILGIAIVLFLSAACSVALAAENTKSLPNLVGTWTCPEMKVYFHKGARLSTDGIRVIKQDGPYFRGIHFWEHTEKEKTVAHVGATPAVMATEPIMGVIGFDGKTIYIVEQGDTGVFHGRLAGADTIEVVYLESGHAAAIARFTWERERNGSP